MKVRDLSGMKNISSLERYYQVGREALKEEIEEMEGF